ncbi:MAG: conjugal transfer protein [Candidatus Parcubacteria bacterium]|nr:MAG: conjugal transfer protein [Candidatus Parcubacteria bacterium]
MINIPKIPFLKQNQKAKIPIPQELTAFEKVKELIAPPGAEFATDYFQIGNIFGRTFLVIDYPSYLFSGWLEKIINLDEAFNLSLYFYPLETGAVLKQLEKQLARISVQILEREEAGKVRSPELEAAYKNVEELRDLLAQAEERMLKVGLYLTIFASDKKELDQKSIKISKILESILVTVKPIMFLQKEAFISTLPLGLDEIKTNYHLNSSTASSFFPFISSELVDESGIFFGINLQNAGFVILDRWKYENPHLIILARSGSGKSYTAKLEVMRNLMIGTDVLILDPENEYQSITDLYGGSFIPLSLKADNTFNPFDLPPVLPNEEPIDIYKEHIADLIIFCQLIMNEKLSSEDLAILDQAINQTYASFNILPHQDFSKIERFPTLNDLEKILNGLVGGSKIASKLYPYTQGNFSGFVNKPTTVELNKRLIVFGFKDLPEILKPIGMFVVLNYILNRVRREMKKRLVIIDEAWWIMRQEIGAEFLLNVVKRGRKYNLAVTNITQDVEDFLNSPYGRPIITNSAIVFLMKQSTATIDLCGQTFALSEGEKQFLLQAERGQGLILVGQKKAPVYVLASYAEDQIIRTRPEQLIALRKAKEALMKK